MVYHDRQNQNTPNVIFIELQKFDTADKKCFTVYQNVKYTLLIYIISVMTLVQKLSQEQLLC